MLAYCLHVGYGFPLGLEFKGRNFFSFQGFVVWQELLLLIGQHKPDVWSQRFPFQPSWGCAGAAPSQDGGCLQRELPSFLDIQLVCRAEFAQSLMANLMILQ